MSGYYDSESLSRALKRLENRYGLASEDFYVLHETDDPRLAGIQGFTRHVWADLFVTAQRMAQRPALLA